MQLQNPYEETVLCLDHGGGPMNLHGMKSQHTCDKSARNKIGFIFKGTRPTWMWAVQSPRAGVLE